MKMENIKRYNFVFLIWALFDFLHIAFYSVYSYRLGKIPYVTDLMSTAKIVVSHGGIVAGGMAILSTLLQLSFFASFVMFFLMKRKVKTLCYFQTPLRLLFFVPSVSIIIPFLSLFGEINTIVVITMIIFSEALKVYSLRKWT